MGSEDFKAFDLADQIDDILNQRQTDMEVSRSPIFAQQKDLNI